MDASPSTSTDAIVEQRSTTRRRLYMSEFVTITGLDGEEESIPRTFPPEKEPHFEFWWAPSGEENPYADWTIVVESQDKSLNRSFTVHQKMLSCKSKYFQSLFEGNFAESQEKRCTFRGFPKFVVQHFDVFLDSVYIKGFFPKDETQKPLDPTEAMTLQFLFDYFQMEYRQQQCETHLKEILTRPTYSNLADLVNCLKECDIPSIWDRIVSKFMATPRSKPRNEPNWRYHFCKTSIAAFIEKIGVDGLMELLRQLKIRDVNGPTLPELIANVCERCKLDIDTATFLWLTDTEILPQIEKYGAMHLLRIVQDFETESANDKDHLDALKNLKDRCFDEVYYSLVFREPLDFCLSWEFRRDMDIDTLTALVHRAWKDTGHSIAPITDDPSSLDGSSMSDDSKIKWVLHEALEQVKLSNASSVALQVEGCNHLFLDGKCIRKGDYYLGHIFAGEVEVRVEKSKSGGHWEIRMVGRRRTGGTAYFESSAPSLHEGCPPFSDWKEMDGTDAAISIKF